MLTNRLFYNALLAGLLLFGLTLPLSKSAGNVLLFLFYPAVIVGMARYKDFKDAILSNIRQPLTIAFLLYFLVSLVGVLYTQRYSDGFHTANKFLGLLAIYVMVSVLMQTIQGEEKRHQQAEKILFAFLIGLMILNVIGVMTYLGIVGHKKFVLPLAPLNVHHIWFSNLNAVGIYCGASFLLFSQRRRNPQAKAFLILFILIALFCILLSLSRTAWFGIILTMIIISYLMLKNRKVFIITVASAIAICILLYVFNSIVHDRIDMIVSDISKFSSNEAYTYTSLGNRFLMWKASFMMFQSNPLIGVGTGDYVSTMTAYVKAGLFPEFLLEYNQPHNMYLFALATNGLLGLSALLFIFYRGLRYALPVLKSGGEKRLFAFVAVATLVHFMIAGMTDSFFNIQILRYTFAFIMGVCVRNSLSSAPDT
jgi:O-antigen ligase